MFILRKILNGRINVSEPLVMQVTALSAEIAEGTPVTISNGACATASGDVTVEYVTAATAPNGATSVPVLLVTRDMIFEVPAISGAKVGNKYQVTTTGVGTTAASSGFGACVIEAATDYALVRLA
ncbi:MAG: hypothetical protein IIY01_01825 [Clostridia bacterium]|nr:hypothetical protein [Clostridia bacterium]